MTTILRPSIADERQLALRELIRRDSSGFLADHEKERLATRLDSPWRSPSTVVRIGFFILGLLAFAMTSSLVGSLVAGIAAIGVAELLIVSKRVRSHGVEESLWLLGSVWLVFELFATALEDHVVFLVAVTLFLAGMRLLNFLFVGLGAIAAFASIWIETGSPSAVTVSGLAIAFAMLLLQRREWRRPFTSLSLDSILIVSFIASCLGSARGLWIENSEILSAALLLAAGGLLLLFGVRWRIRSAVHAVLLGAWLPASSIVSIIEADLSLKLLLSGSLLMIVGLGVERLLRERSDGLTSMRLSGGAGNEIFEIATVAATGVHAAGQPVEGDDSIGQGGGFGGGGATDRW